MKNLKNALPKVLIYTLVLEALIVADQLLDPFNLPKLFILITGSTLMLYILISCYLELIIAKFRLLIILFATFLGWQIIVLIFTNGNLVRGLLGIFGRNNGLISYLGLCVLMVAGAIIAYTNNSFRVLRAISILGFVESLYGIMQIQKADIFNWVYAGNPVFMTFGNEDFGAAFLVVSILVSTYFLTFIKHDLYRIANLINITLQLYVLLHINTAQSKISLIGSLAIFVILKFRDIASKGKIQFVSISIFSFSTILASIFGLIGAGPFSFIHSNLGSLQSRFLHWEAGWLMFRDHPVFGVGLDSYVDYQSKYRVFDSNGNLDTLSDNPHNTFVQMLATGGILLFLCYLLLFIYLYFILGKFILSKKIDLNSKIFYASIVLAFSVNSIISIDNLGITQLYWVFNGMLIGALFTSTEISEKSIPAKKLVVKVNSENTRLAAILVIAIFFPADFLIGMGLVSQFQIKQSYKIQSSNPRDSVNANRIYDIASTYNDAFVRNSAIKMLYDSGFTDLGFKLALASHKEFPRSVYTLEAIAQYYAKKSMAVDEARIREIEISLDPKFAAFQERLNQLKQLNSKG